MLNAVEARTQSERAAKTLDDEARRTKDRVLADGQETCTKSLKDYVIGCLGERIYGAIKGGKTEVYVRWPCDDYAMWMDIMQDIAPFFAVRGYKINGIRSRDDGGVWFDITVSW